MSRQFVKPNFEVTTWDLLKPYFNELLDREINSPSELEKWLIDGSELGAVVSEDMAWRYIKMTCDTANTELRDRFNDFVQNIEPNMAPLRIYYLSAHREKQHRVVQGKEYSVKYQTSGVGTAIRRDQRCTKY